MIAGIIPEWQETDQKRKKGVIALLGTWIGEMMNCARMHMKKWTVTKNEHKGKVQHRWDNRDKMRGAFQNWRKRVGNEIKEQMRGEEDEKRGREKERTYGIKNW
eukprot:6194343-Pleurochrysis_carterae.AAC.1